MRELEVLLKRHDKKIEFDHVKNRIRCYPHIINICSSHIIASSTRISKEFLETFRSESDSDLVYSNIEEEEEDDDDDDDNDNDDDDNDDNDDDDDDDDDHLFVPELTLNEKQLDTLTDEARSLYTGLKRDPIKRARRIVRIVRSSDQRKQAFKNVIHTGNYSGWFKSDDDEVIEVPDLELLRDVKTRWDSVYCMIERLLILRPVSVHTVCNVWISFSFISLKFYTRTGHRLLF